jgi:hypothetical protein
LVVFGVVADPESDQPFRAITRQHAIVQTHTG